MESKNFTTVLPKEVQEVLDQKVPVLLQTANQAHIYHLLTHSLKKHKALEALYDTIREKADKIGETWIALGGKIIVSDIPVLSTEFSNEILVKFLEEFLESIVKCLELTKDIDFLSSINDAIAEIQEATENALYFAKQ